MNIEKLEAFREVTLLGLWLGTLLSNLVSKVALKALKIDVGNITF